MLKKLGFAFLVALVIILAILAQTRMYIVGDAADGVLFWNSNEADIFLKIVNRGYRMSYLQYLVKLPKELLGGVPTPDANHFSGAVLRLDPEGVLRYGKEEIEVGSFELVDGKVCSRNLKDGVLWVWSGTQLEPAGIQVERNLEEAQRAFKVSEHPLGPDFDGMNGWSGRYSIPYRNDGTKFDMEVHGQKLTVIVRKSGNTISINLINSGKREESIWKMNNRTRKVTKTEYEKLFGTY
jgi:hypothetical protein